MKHFVRKIDINGLFMEDTFWEDNAKPEVPAIPAVPLVPAVLDKDGGIITPEIPEVLEVPVIPVYLGDPLPADLIMTPVPGGLYWPKWDGDEWVEGGAAPVIPPEQIIADIEKAIDLYIDSVAKEKGYGTATLCPTAACMIYAGYANEYQAEAVAFGIWKASLWPLVYAIQVDVMAGNRTIPTSAEVIMELPVMVWPV